jgi:hypothetical protein
MFEVERSRSDVGYESLCYAHTAQINIQYERLGLKFTRWQDLRYLSEENAQQV